MQRPGASGTGDRRSGTCGNKIMLQIWKQWETLWKIRNDEVHGKNESTRVGSLRRKVERQFRAVHDNQHHLELRVQEVLHREAYEHLQRPLWVTRNWLATHAPVFFRKREREYETGKMECDEGSEVYTVVF